MLAAAARRAQPERRDWHRRPRCRLAIGMVAFAAVASVVVMTVVPTHDRRSLRGAIAQAPPTQPPVSDYAVRLEPDLRVGRIGWCTTLTRAGDTARRVGEQTCRAAAVSTQPLIAAGGTKSASPQHRSLEYLVVDQSIVAVRAASRRVIPRHDPALPADWRVAVLRVPAAAGGDRIDLENADGQPLALDDLPGGRAATQPAAHAAIDAAAPGSCAIRLVAADAAHASDARRVQRVPRSGPRLNGRPYLSCATLIVHRAHGPVHLTLLVDAGNPTARPADLPGARPGPPGITGVVRLDSETLARRDGNAWLVARGHDTSDTIEILEDASAETNF